jgi:acyl-CoA synthetase (AMP-forming)/AMP-acid ligase II
MIVAGTEHMKVVDEVANAFEGLDANQPICTFNGRDDEPSPLAVNAEVDQASVSELGERHRPRGDDPMAFLFTSGTTGLPKAATITNGRFLMASYGFGHVMHEATPGDVIYSPLPLYHGTAQWGGWGAALSTGAAIALRRRFSASEFWDDVRRFEATRFMYIGELCRYLLLQPPSERDRSHGIRVAVGNGLRKDVWVAFQERFAIPLIREFYGATEGNAPMANLEGRPGMIGRMGIGQVVVECDLATGEPTRNKTGFLTKLRNPGTTGLLLGKITALARFDGYVDAQASEKKILRNVFKNGDAYFNSGDLLNLEEDGWVSFADRVGDTFRWKGENVSTHEVAEVLNGARGVREANVYGVQVPGAEGRAGMASLNVGDDFDLQGFAKYVVERLPNYKRPYFARIQSAMQVTSTLKHKKVDYRREGYDPSQVSDPLYFLDGDRYIPIDDELYGRIQASRAGPR